MKAIILAAGKGKRLRPLTESLPKPLLHVGGKPLISYTLNSLKNSGIEEVVINTSYLAHRIHDALGDGNAYGLKLTYSYEPQPLEIGGGIFHALPLLGSEPFLVISGDIWTDYPLHQLSNSLSGLAHLVLVNNPDFHPEGDFYLEETHISLTGEIKLTYANLAVIDPKLFKDCKPGSYPLYPLILKAIESKQVTGEHYQGAWFNVGTPKQLEQLNNQLSL